MKKQTKKVAVELQSFVIKVVAVAGKDPLTGKDQPEQVEMVTVQAEDVQDARALSDVYRKMRANGQLLRYFHNDVEIFGRW